MDNHFSWSCSGFARKKKAAVVQHDGITAKADEIEALQGVLSGTAAVKVAVGAPARGKNSGEK